MSILDKITSFSESKGGTISPDLDQRDEMKCSHPNRVLLAAWSDEKNTLMLYRPTCGLWSCHECAKRNRKKWVLRVSHGLTEYTSGGEVFQFTTVTSHARLKSREATIDVWPNAWSKIYARIKRKKGANFHYVLVPEFHENGRLHVHMLENSGLTRRWYKDNAPQCGLGYMAEVLPVEKPSGAAWYVSKYLGKGLEDSDWPLQFRRIRTSQNWPLLPQRNTDDVDLSWEVISGQRAIASILRTVQDSRVTAVLLNTNRYLYWNGELVDSETIPD